LQVIVTITSSFVNCYAWPPKGQSSEKSWYAINLLSFGKEDCSGKKTLEVKRFLKKNTNQPNGFSEWSLDLLMWQHKRAMFMLNNLVESKVAVLKNRKITENSGWDFIRKN